MVYRGMVLKKGVVRKARDIYQAEGIDSLTVDFDELPIMKALGYINKAREQKRAHLRVVQ